LKITSIQLFKGLAVAFFIFIISIGTLIWRVNTAPKAGGDFNLTYRGQSWKFSNDPKRLNLLYFGYAKCPDVCPLTLSYAGSAFKNLSVKELSQIRLIFVSVDQEHDDPVAVAEYATNFYSSFTGLSGSREQIDSAIKLFPASYMIEKNAKSYLGYSIAHTDRIFFLDDEGIVMDSLSSPRESDLVLNKIRENL
jgi:protein SCO1